MNLSKSASLTSKTLVSNEPCRVRAPESSFASRKVRPYSLGYGQHFASCAHAKNTYFFLTSPESRLSFKPITRYVRSCSSKHARIKGKLFFLLRLLILTPGTRSRSTSVSQMPRRNRTPGCVNRARSGPCLSCTMRWPRTMRMSFLLMMEKPVRIIAWWTDFARPIASCSRVTLQIRVSALCGTTDKRQGAHSSRASNAFQKFLTSQEPRPSCSLSPAACSSS